MLLHIAELGQKSTANELNKSSKNGQSKKESPTKNPQDMKELLTAKADIYRISELDEEQAETNERHEKEGVKCYTEIAVDKHPKIW